MAIDPVEGEAPFHAFLHEMEVSGFNTRNLENFTVPVHVPFHACIGTVQEVFGATNALTVPLETVGEAVRHAVSERFDTGTAVDLGEFSVVKMEAEGVKLNIPLTVGVTALTSFKTPGVDTPVPSPVVPESVFTGTSSGVSGSKLSSGKGSVVYQAHFVADNEKSGTMLVCNNADMLSRSEIEAIALGDIMGEASMQSFTKDMHTKLSKNSTSMFVVQPNTMSSEWTRLMRQKTEDAKHSRTGRVFGADTSKWYYQPAGVVADERAGEAHYNMTANLFSSVRDMVHRTSLEDFKLQVQTMDGNTFASHKGDMALELQQKGVDINSKAFSSGRVILQGALRLTVVPMGTNLRNIVESYSHEGEEEDA